MPSPRLRLPSAREGHQRRIAAAGGDVVEVDQFAGPSMSFMITPPPRASIAAYSLWP
jgi:hypothetical protein